MADQTAKAPNGSPLRWPTPAEFGEVVGRMTVATGLLLLAFAAYQLWGTGLAETRAQDRLAAELAAGLDRSVESPMRSWSWTDEEPGLHRGEKADSAIVVAPPPPVEPVRATPPPELGAPFARLHIPAIGVDKTVVEGTTREVLRTGPGHYWGTARPGSLGNVAIAGHRTTYGAPFRDIDQLAPGDPIVVETADGVFTYRVEGQPGDDGDLVGHRIVAPEKVDVIADKGDHRLTLTACHPLYSARQRIIVTAVLDDPGLERSDRAILEMAQPRPPAPPSTGEASGAAPPTGPPTSGPVVERPARLALAADDPSPAAGNDPVSADDLGWQPAHASATATWAGLSALVVAAALALGRLWRRWPAYLMAGPSFTLCLLTCFGHLDQLIPAT